MGAGSTPVELDAVARRSRYGGAARLADMRFQSSVTLVEDGAFYYRGTDPIELSRSTSFEGVAEMLWSGADPSTSLQWAVDHEAVELGRSAGSRVPDRSSVLDRLRAIVPVVGAGDDLRFDLRPEAVASRGGAILASVAAACGSGEAARHVERVWGDAHDRAPTNKELALVESAMVLLADHEVAASTAAVRIAASFRADPYAALGSGLAVLSGAYHGAASVDVARLLAEAVDLGSAAAVGDVLRRDGPGARTGPDLYHEGDPRYSALLDQVEAAQPSSAPVVAAREVEAIAAERGLPPPNVDFALAVLALTLDLGRRAGETVFAFARMAGWLAHGIEEYAERTDLRLRANYVGARPSIPASLRPCLRFAGTVRATEAKWCSAPWGGWPLLVCGPLVSSLWSRLYHRFAGTVRATEAKWCSAPWGGWPLLVCVLWSLHCGSGCITASLGPFGPRRPSGARLRGVVGLCWCVVLRSLYCGSPLEDVGSGHQVGDHVEPQLGGEGPANRRRGSPATALHCRIASIGVRATGPR